MAIYSNMPFHPSVFIKRVWKWLGTSSRPPRVFFIPSASSKIKACFKKSKDEMQSCFDLTIQLTLGRVWARESF